MSSCSVFHLLIIGHRSLSFTNITVARYLEQARFKHGRGKRKLPLRGQIFLTIWVSTYNEYCVKISCAGSFSAVTNYLKKSPLLIRRILRDLQAVVCYWLQSEALTPPRSDSFSNKILRSGRDATITSISVYLISDPCYHVNLNSNTENEY